ncbi:hypothetical protein HG531_003967 [Fusarium graminearum]|nr:hypothetical protein HG531_003967 [Fusarium graminearum]
MARLSCIQTELVHKLRCSCESTAEINKTAEQLERELDSQRRTRIQTNLDTLAYVSVGCVLWLPSCSAVLASIKSVKVNVSRRDGNSCTSVDCDSGGSIHVNSDSESNSWSERQDARDFHDSEGQSVRIVQDGTRPRCCYIS